MNIVMRYAYVYTCINTLYSTRKSCLKLLIIMQNEF